MREQAGPFHMDELEAIAAVGLGGNTGDVSASFRHAVDRLDAADGCRVVAASSLYETDPVGPIPQPAFLNAAVLVATKLEPRPLLALLLGIERERGRNRASEERWGPRTLDLDLLLFGERVIDEPDLRVPHPRLAERRFVLEPLAEILPDSAIPGHDAPARVLAMRLVGTQSVRRLSGRGRWC